MAACTLLLAIATAYWPGLSGDFIFDDFANLDVVGAYGNPWQWPEFLFYITSGGADPTGRPVALLTFLIDGSSWPTDPWPFKRTNVALHLVNTALLAWTISRLLESVGTSASTMAARNWIPLLAAALWGVHPFFVSTTLYVVQREAMLPMTFALLGMLSWISGTRSFASGRAAQGWSWCVLGFGLSTVLAGLSKANGFLTPMLVGLCYLYFLRGLLRAHAMRKHADIASAILLGLPTLLILVYLTQVGVAAWGPEPIIGRNWTLAERLLSQPRALWDYVGRLAIPRAGGGGVFVENFVASRGWWSPWTTIPAVAALTLSIALTWMLRRRWPVASFAWAFFLCAHLLESSTVALELYFEHRNYLPAMFLGWPVAQVLLARGPLRRVRIGVSGLLVLILLVLTHQRASVWGSPSLIGALTASHESDSARAQVAAANVELDRGSHEAAVNRMRALSAKSPASIDVTINAIGIECQALGRLSPAMLASAQRALRESPKWNFGLYLWLRDAAHTPAMTRCEGFGIPALMSLVEAAEENPHAQSAVRQRDLRHVRGQIALAQGNPSEALTQFDQTLKLAADPEYALVQAAALGNAGHPSHALEHLALLSQLQSTRAPEAIRNMHGLHRWLLEYFDYHDSELDELRRKLELDVEQRARASVEEAGASG